MICEDASIAEEAEALENMSRESKRKYFGNAEHIENKIDDTISENK